jgi:hypothetical protein
MDQALITSIELIAPKEMNSDIREYHNYVKCLSGGDCREEFTLDGREALEKNIISQLEVHLNIELDKYLKISNVAFSAPPYYMMQYTLKLERKHPI